METKSAQVVIFSSGSQRNTILKLSEELEKKNCNCTLWTNLFTRQNDNSKFALLPTLLKKIPTFDFAIILATPDDSVNRIRDGVEENFQCMRDNVIFEIGLCVIALGANRTIILQNESVHLFDDLIGVSGVNNTETMLSASALGVKCFTYSDVKRLEQIYDPLVDYINSEMQVFSPVVIGAACSTAIGYYNMFIKRIVRGLDSPDFAMKDKEVRVLVPLYISSSIFKDIDDYYADNGFSKMTRKMDSGRDMSFYYKMENDSFIVCDIPTSIGASYQMAQDILSIEAADIDDVDSEKRFLMKEANMFYLTLKKLLAEELTNSKVKIVLERMCEN